MQNRLNPQSAMRNMQSHFTHSNLEPCGPRNGLQTGPRSSRGVRSAPCFRGHSESADDSGA
eukprot:6595491-Alexandrium_andersonii.AAC.1